MKSIVLKRLAFFTLVLQMIMAPVSAYAAIVTGSFGSHGEGGRVNEQEFTFGTDGLVHELDTFINIAGRDLNGSGEGTSHILSNGDPPAGIGYVFSYESTPGRTALLIRYELTNTTTAPIPGFKFFVLLDAEIGPEFTDEFGSTAGNLGTGSGDANPDSWEIDEPGFTKRGNMYRHLMEGKLDNKNNVPANSQEDVSMALGFDLGTLDANSVSSVSLFISDSGESWSKYDNSVPRSLFTLKQSDNAQPNSLSLSGASTSDASRQAILQFMRLFEANDRPPLDALAVETTRSRLGLWLGMGIGAFITVLVVVILMLRFKRKKSKTVQPPRIY